MHIVASSITTTSRNRQHLLAVVALLMLFLVFCGYALFADDYTQWDASISHWTNTLRSPSADRFMLSITMMADLPLSTALITAIAIGLMVRKHWWLTVYLLCTFFSTTLSVGIIKSVTQRSRPALTDSTLLLMSFPSGHATRAVLVFGILALLMSCGRSAQCRTVALLLAGMAGTMVAISRVYLGVHWTSDVLAGATLAAVMLIGVDWQLRIHEMRSVKLPIKPVLATIIVGYLTYYFYQVTSQAQIYGITIADGPLW